MPARKNKKESNRVVYLTILVLSIVFVGLAFLVYRDYTSVQKKSKSGIETHRAPKTTTAKKKPEDLYPEIEKNYRRALESLGITSKYFAQKGVVPGRGKERLLQRVYLVKTEKQWNLLRENLEDKLREYGVTVHNRNVTKSLKKWRYKIFIGTPKKRTHRLEIHYYPEKKPTPSARRTRPSPRAKRPSPAIALVIDDFGYKMDIANRFLNSLDYPVTLAVIPTLKHTRDVITAIKKKGQTAFLHLPLEPMSAKAMASEKSMFLTTAMSNRQIERRLNEYLDALPPVDGVNNHMGSKFTADARCMKALLKVLKKRHLPFLDSRTTANSVACSVAKSLGVPHAARAVFIDQGNKGGDVAKNLDRLVKIARKKGAAIGIGHARQETLDVLVKKLPEIEKDVRIVPVLDLMN